MPNKEPYIVKFTSLDGTVFHLRCKSVFDAMLDRSFWGFLILCNTLFAAQNVLMSELLVPRVEALHWTGLVFGFAIALVNVLALVAIVLTVLGLVFFRLIKWKLLKTIHVPFFYIFPTALYCLSALLQDRNVISQNTVMITVLFLIICACVDILYGRFAAPLHSKYIGLDDLKAFSNASEDKETSSTGVVKKPISPDATPDQQPLLTHPDAPAAELPTTAELSTDKNTQQHNLVTSPARDSVNIGKQHFFCDEIRWIQSEDHYLNVHLATESVLLLGKLYDAVAQLPKEHGVQINRSMWVAHTAIQSIDAPNSRKMFVTLTDGQTLKVTPTGRKLLEKANKERAIE